ncbi:hypothetical protein RJ639_040070, partial [Escallonia herrerae]
SYWGRKADFPMGVRSLCRGVFLGFLVALFSASFCYGVDKTVEVVGVGECADCKASNIKTSQALSGLRVTIECKTKKGELKTRAVGHLNGEGKFKVSLPQEFIQDGKLKQECYAQLHSASATPCATHEGLEASKIVFQSKSDEKHTFSTKGKLKFSSAVCTSKFLWPYFKYPPLPTLPPLPPLKFFGHPYLFPPLPPKPLPPPIPINKFPLPPPVPIYVKPLPPPVPVYVKPLPPPVPVYKPPVYVPKPPVYTPKPHPPVYVPKPPVYTPKPHPPVYVPKPPVYTPKPHPPVYVPKPPVYTPKPHPP